MCIIMLASIYKVNKNLNKYIFQVLQVPYFLFQWLIYTDHVYDLVMNPEEPWIISQKYHYCFMVLNS